MFFGFLTKLSHKTSLSGCDLSLDALDKFVDYCNSRHVGSKEEKEAMISLMLISSQEGLKSILSNMEVEIPNLDKVLKSKKELPYHHHYAVKTVHAMVKDSNRMNKNQPLYYAHQFCVAFLNILSTPIGFEGRAERWQRLSKIYNLA
jgi:hypothetical protein